MSLAQRQKIAALRAQVAQLEQALAAEGLEEDGLKAQVADLRTQVTALQSTIADLEAEEARDDEQITALQSVNDGLEDQVSDLNTRIRDAQDAKSQVDSQLASAKASLSTCQQSVSQLQAALQEARDDLSTVESKLGQANVTIDDLRRQLAEATDPDPDPDPPSDTRPYFGSSMQNNGDVTPMETSAGRTLGLHRTYWNYSQIDSSISTAKADVAKGRVPWLSYKLSVTWTQVLTGQADAATKALAVKLATVPGEVWVAIHHEPEGDGAMVDWVRVQQRLLTLLKAGAPNVRTSVIYTGWTVFYSGNPEFALDAIWPTGGMVDILGVDMYNRYGDADHPTSGWTEMKQHYDKIAAAAKQRGVDWAIGETGYTDAAAVKDKAWLARAYDDMANHSILKGLGISYFNSTANSNGSWALNSLKTPVFNDALKRSHAPLK